MRGQEPDRPWILDRELGRIEVDSGVSVEAEGLRLADGEVMEWKRLLDAGDLEQVSLIRERITRRGQPWWSLETRFRRQDWSRAAVAAREVLAADFDPGSPAMALACLALLRESSCRLQPEQCAVWWIRLLEQRQTADCVGRWGPLAGVTGQELALGVTALNPPVFVDREAAELALELLDSLREPGNPAGESALAVYGSALELAADRAGDARNRLQRWTPPEEMLPWKVVWQFAVGLIEGGPADSAAVREIAAGSGEEIPGLVATARWWLTVEEFRQLKEQAPRDAWTSMLGLAIDQEHASPVVQRAALLVADGLARREGWSAESRATSQLLRSTGERWRLVGPRDAWPR